MPVDINSDVGICRLALSKLGTDSTIESFTEDSAEARECDLWYNTALDAILTANPWKFATKRLTLAAHGDDPPDGVWGFRYQYPADALKLWYLENPTGQTSSSSAFWTNDPVRIDGSAGNAVPFNVEISTDGTKSIMTNLADAIGVYTFQQRNVNLFPHMFKIALALLIAYSVAPAITEGSSKTDKMLAAYNGFLPVAMASDANEKITYPPREADWIAGR